MEAQGKQLGHTSSTKNLHQNADDYSGHNSRRIYSTFFDNSPRKKIASSPNFFCKESGQKDFFEEEQNTKKKTTKKITTRTTSNG